jgi:hypothetical protein
MGITRDAAIRILEAGASLKVSGLSKDSYLELARVARARGVQLEINGNGLSYDSMAEIASVGQESVVFDVSD